MPVSIPLSPPTDYPVIVEGYASTTDIDFDHVKMRAWAFPILPWQKTFPPLLYKHDQNQVAGKIEDLSYDDHGNLRIRAHVDHPLARRCGAFSIAAKVIAYEMHDTDSAGFYATVTNAEITEVSLTDRPANPQALVKRRYRASPAVRSYKLLGEKVKRLSQLATLIKEIDHGHCTRCS